MRKAKLLWRMRSQRKKPQFCPILSTMTKASFLATHMGSRAPDSQLSSLSLPCWSGGPKGSGIACLKSQWVFGALLISGWGSSSSRSAKLPPHSLPGCWWGDWCRPHVPSLARGNGNAFCCCLAWPSRVTWGWTAVSEGEVSPLARFLLFWGMAHATNKEGAFRLWFLPCVQFLVLAANRDCLLWFVCLAFTPL